jgi:hypothetical protein
LIRISLLFHVLRIVLAGALIGTAPLVHARANLTGLWWVPSESGWGVNFDHQRDFLFATWFIYDSEGKPRWVVGQLDSAGSGAEFTGPVFRTTGTPFDVVPFNPSGTMVVQVGSARVQVSGDNDVTLTYSIEGKSVTKSITRQATKPISLVGQYDGLSAGATVFDTDQTDFTISLETDGRMKIVRDSFFGGLCEFYGVPQQVGSRITVPTGTYRCQQNFAEGTWRSTDLQLIDDFGFSGTISAVRVSPPGGSSFTQRFMGIKIR